MAERRRRGRGEGSIYQLPDGRWQGSVELGWVNGKRRRRTVTRKSRTAVSRDLRRLIDAAESGHLTAEKPPTVEAWLRTYLRDVAPSRVRPRTLHSYVDQSERHIIPYLGRHRLDRLRPQHLSEFYRTRAEALSPSSIRRLHAILRRALTVAVRWGLISTNPAQMVDPPSLRTRELHPYTVEEARVFLGAAAKDRLEARWVVAVTLGLRQGETLGLQWSDVDFERRVLHIRRALQQKPDGGLALVETKTLRARRQLPMPQSVVDALLRHRTAQAGEQATAGDQWTASDLVFTTTVGTPIHPRNDYRAFRAVVQRAGLRRVRLHDLRHTAASLLLAQGVPARVVMEILGHSQIGITLNTYTHVAPELNRIAADRIDAVLWPKEEDNG